MTVVEEARMILADVVNNNNKFWNCALEDSGDCITTWGRVGYSGSSTTFPGIGKRGFDKKVHEKERKGYTHAQVVPGIASSTVTDRTNLSDVATREIVKDGDPVLASLISKLVHANVHQITSNTQIVYNSTTGLYQTPLGVITLDAIMDARKHLESMANILGMGLYLNSDIVNKYLRLIPQNVGMKLDINKLFPNLEAIEKQSELLDSLEASYAAMVKTTQKTISAERVFCVEVNTINNSSEASRISDLFEKTKKREHNYGNIKVINIFSVSIEDMRNNFRNTLTPVRELWHGTLTSNLLSILKSGLKIRPPSTTRINGKMFSNGIYGAPNSSKSLGYSMGRWGGPRDDSAWLFLADFALGRIYETYTACGLPSGYDSVHGKAGRSLLNDEIIVYKENQCNLKFLVECST